MFGEATRRLSSWLATNGHNAEVLLVPASDTATGGPSVLAFLVNIHSLTHMSDRRRRPGDDVVVRVGADEAVLRYVVAVDGDLPADRAHDLLGGFFLAAADEADISVVDEPVDWALWSAFGTHPRPALLIDVHVRAERLFDEDDVLVRQTRVAARPGQPPWPPTTRPGTEG